MDTQVLAKEVTSETKKRRPRPELINSRRRPQTVEEYDRAVREVLAWAEERSGQQGPGPNEKPKAR